MKEIVDSHSHLGLGFDSKVATIDDYKRLKKILGITISLLMPQPILDLNQTRSELLFDQINKKVDEEIKKTNDDSYKFVPTVSPVYTSPKKLEEYIQLYKPLAFKIHMRADNSNPSLISNDWIKILKKYNIPLIVHTDYSKDSKTKKDILKNLNSSLNWMLFFQKNDIKGYLTHGARLNKEVFEKINKTDNILIGMGPDLLLQKYSSSALEQQGDYLKILYDNVNPDKLAFDIDFNWNLDNDGNLDSNSIKRLENYWTEDQLAKILCKNSKKLFNIK